MKILKKLLLSSCKHWSTAFGGKNVKELVIMDKRFWEAKRFYESRATFNPNKKQAGLSCGSVQAETVRLQLQAKQTAYANQALP